MRWRALVFYAVLALAEWASSDSKAEQPPRFEEIRKIDAHVHIFDELPEFVEMLRRTQTRVINICVGGSQPELLLPCEQRAEDFRHRFRPHFHFASTFDLTRREAADYTAQVTNWLGGTFQNGAALVKLWKDVGMQLRTASGDFLMPDDAVFDPIYYYLESRGYPLMTHSADPMDAWEPLDPASPHYSYYAKHAEWHVYGRAGFPAHNAILSARDRVLVKHPALTMIAAHVGSEAHDLAGLEQRLTRFPRLHLDVAARTPELQRQPASVVRDFFLRYQDRLLYGTDADHYTPDRSPTMEERVEFTKAMEKLYQDEFTYYSGSGRQKVNGREIECLALPHTVLEKFYHGNAERLMPTLISN